MSTSESSRGEKAKENMTAEQKADRILTLMCDLSPADYSDAKDKEEWKALDVKLLKDGAFMDTITTVDDIRSYMISGRQDAEFQAEIGGPAYVAPDHKDAGDIPGRILDRMLEVLEKKAAQLNIQSANASLVKAQKRLDEAKDRLKKLE